MANCLAGGSSCRGRPGSGRGEEALPSVRCVLGSWSCSVVSVEGIRCLRASAHCVPRPARNTSDRLKFLVQFCSPTGWVGVERGVRSLPGTGEFGNWCSGHLLSRTKLHVFGVSRSPRRSGLLHRIFFSAAGERSSLLLFRAVRLPGYLIFSGNDSDFNSSSTGCLPPRLQIFSGHHSGSPPSRGAQDRRPAAQPTRPMIAREDGVARRVAGRRRCAAVSREPKNSVVAVVDIGVPMLYLRLRHRVRESRGRVENELPGAVGDSRRTTPSRTAVHRRGGR